jgi:hypothetical protein
MIQSGLGVGPAQPGWSAVRETKPDVDTLPR